MILGSLEVYPILLERLVFLCQTLVLLPLSRLVGFPGWKSLVYLSRLLLSILDH